MSVSVEGPERSGGPSTAASRPDPEVPEKAKRRQFSAEYKLGILKEADGCQEPGQIAALLRREGLYSSHLTEWRRARREGSLKALAKPRGPKGRGRDPVTIENEQLRKENAGLRQRLKQAETILDIQKKASELLGNPPEPAVERRRRMRAAVETLAPTVGLAPACRALGVARASVYRHRKSLVPKARSSRRPLPCALAPQERTQVLDTLHEDRFLDRAPAAVYATLQGQRSRSRSRESAVPQEESPLAGVRADASGSEIPDIPRRCWRTRSSGIPACGRHPRRGALQPQVSGGGR